MCPKAALYEHVTKRNTRLRIVTWPERVTLLEALRTIVRQEIQVVLDNDRLRILAYEEALD